MNRKMYSFVFFISLLNLPGSLGFFPLYFVLAFIYLLCFFSFKPQIDLARTKSIALKNTGPLFLYFLLLLTSIIRAPEFSIIKLLLFLSYSLFLYAYLSMLLEDCIQNKKNYLTSFRNYIINPFVWTFILNFSLWILNIKSEARSENELFIGNAVILSSIGIYLERVNFLFSSGINSYAVILGAILTFITVDNFLQKKWTISNLIQYAFVIPCILLTDSRTAILFPFLILVLAYIMYHFKLKFILYLGGLIFIASPIILGIVLPQLAEISFFSQFARSDTDLFTMNGRVFIWYFGLQEFMAFKLIHFFGFGFEGHVTSGVCSQWSFLFTSFVDAEKVHPHNSIFSILFDIGYFGLLTLLYIFYKTGRQLGLFWLLEKKVAITYFCLFLYFLLISITESFITLYYLNTMTLVLCFFFFVLSIPPNQEKSPTKL
jgi:O-antigen ligase